jgi:uncharacterized protein YggE
VVTGGAEIVTEGSGWHEEVADRAEFELSFSAAARTRVDAVRELGRRVAAVEPQLSHPAVQVRHRQVWVHDEWNGRRMTGCRAGESISITVTDVSALEDVLSGVIAAEPAGLHGPSWTLADQATARREAQRAAVADARARAEGYAEALGGRLGALRSLSEAPEHGGVYRMAAMDSAGASREMGQPDVRTLSLKPEPVRVTANCTTRWSMVTES